MGQGRLSTISSKVGGMEKLEELFHREDVSKLSSIDGVSEKMAVDLILASKGGREDELEGNQPVEEIIGSVQQILSSYMHTSGSRNRVLLMRPSGKLEGNREKALRNHEKKFILDGRDRKLMESLLSILDRKSSIGSSKSSLPYVLVVEDEEAFEGIREKGLDSRCLVIGPEDLTQDQEGTVILVHNRREINEEMLPIADSIHFTRPAHEMVPEIVLQEMGPIRDRLEAAGELRKMFDQISISSELVDLIDDLVSLQAESKDPDHIREEVERIRKDLDEGMKGEISGLTLSGDDTLSLLSSGEPKQLRNIYSRYSKEAARLVRERLSIRADLFRIKYPLEVDEEVLDRVLDRMNEKVREQVHSEKVRLAGRMMSMREEALKELEWANDLDMDFGIGCFVKDLDLNPFEISDSGFYVKGAADINLRKSKQYQGVDYYLGSVKGNEDTRVALLTGANSGGKTTLLMTVAQVVVMSRMGLPIPAAKARIPEIDRLYIYRPKRRMDAGGLEGFLSELLPMSLEVNGRSMVLADELEAMTELEAASRIIGAFVGELDRREAYSIVVTHMADEVLRFVDCRVDGIEARGLDDHHNLIVDRTPRIGHHARSTPELIIKRLEARSKGKEKEMFSRVLSSFD